MPTFAKKRGVRCWRGVTQVNGEKRTKWFGSSREDMKKAILWEESTKKELLRQLRTDAVRGITLAEWHDAYLDYVHSFMSRKTYDEKFFVLDRFVDEFGEGTKVEEIVPSVVLEYMFDQEAERSGNAANKDRKNLSAGWNWAKEFMSNWPLNTAHSNPFLVVPRRKEARSERYIPSEEDFWKVFDHATGQDKVILATAYYLAARRGELWRLEWKKDIDLPGRRVRLGTTKTADGQWKYTWLPMVEELYQAILTHWSSQRTCAHDFVFWSLSENLDHFGNPFAARQRWLGSLCREVDVQPFGMHAIRHLRAVRLFRDGAPLGSIQKWLRHDRPSTTEIYLRKFGLDFDNLLVVAEASSRRPRAKVVNIDER